MERVILHILSTNLYPQIPRASVDKEVTETKLKNSGKTIFFLSSSLSSS